MIMKHFQLKTLVVALAVAGFATACDRDGARRDAYVPPEQPPIERSTTAPGTTNPGALSTMEDGRYTEDTAAAGIDHEETVQFSGTELTDESEKKLENLVEALDKSKPVAVIVAMQDPSLRSNTEANPNTTGTNAGTNTSTSVPGSTTNPGIASNTTSSRDTSAGNDITGSRDSSASRNPTTDAGGSTGGDIQNESLFSQRVDEVREFLREQGVEVVQWQIEGSTAQQTQQSPSLQEDVQQVRIVIAGTSQIETLSTL
jgi:hypothetical protein